MMTFPTTLDMAPFLTGEANVGHPTQYELYAVLMHTGSAMAGHYFACVRGAAAALRGSGGDHDGSDSDLVCGCASNRDCRLCRARGGRYIKDLAAGAAGSTRWLHFNDSSVTEIGAVQLARAFGQVSEAPPADPSSAGGAASGSSSAAGGKPVCEAPGGAGGGAVATAATATATAPTPPTAAAASSDAPRGGADRPLASATTSAYMLA